MAIVSHDSEIPAHGQQIISVTGFIHHDFNGTVKVFLPKRADTKKFMPSVWEMPGGHVDFGEDIVEGLKREVLEELDMHISVGDPYSAMTYMNEVKGSHSIEVTYFARFTDPIENVSINPEDHSDMGWFAENEIDTLTDARTKEDQEIKAIKKGFKLLRGGKLNFG